VIVRLNHVFANHGEVSVNKTKCFIGRQMHDLPLAEVPVVSEDFYSNGSHNLMVSISGKFDKNLVLASINEYFLKICLYREYKSANVHIIEKEIS